ncbi:uncharacterized protein LOC134532904 [Bacillus rossius redtenbacheri]|uniref:uncharacterized protein LOC134532904 n=1 Tax=Bacillus rossius redtenbacheri TaxID=93214 RepID=UPI002FDD76AE
MDAGRIVPYSALMLFCTSHMLLESRPVSAGPLRQVVAAGISTAAGSELQDDMEIEGAVMFRPTYLWPARSIVWSGIFTAAESDQQVGTEIESEQQDGPEIASERQDGTEIEGSVMSRPTYLWPARSTLSSDISKAAESDQKYGLEIESALVFRPTYLWPARSIVSSDISKAADSEQQDGTQIASEQQDGPEIASEQQDGPEIASDQQDGTEIESDQQGGTEIESDQQGGTEIESAVIVMFRPAYLWPARSIVSSDISTAAESEQEESRSTHLRLSQSEPTQQRLSGGRGARSATVAKTSDMEVAESIVFRPVFRRRRRRRRQ